MKRMLNKTWRSFVALLLVFSMVLGVSGNLCAVVAEAAKVEDNGMDESKEFNYVSLGDSMTNGYGLPGYNGNTGVYDYGDGSYANQFAEWLETSTGKDVNHAQLAMSAMRAEDLHWLLEFDYTDEEAVKVAEMEEWNEEDWNSKFSTGDYWTWNELCDDYRFETAATYIEAYVNGNADALDAIEKNPQSEFIEKGETAIVAKEYQETVKNADVISLGIGNGNFGVFTFGRILEAIGFSGEPADALVYNVERAIAECEPEMQAQIMKLIDELYALVEEKLGQPIDENETLNALANTVVYAGISYVLNYAGTVEAILQLNPDAEIILVALMNTMATDQEAEGATLGDLMAVMFKPLNAYIAGLPAYMQATKNGVYADAKFYYAEAPEVECLVDTYGDDFYNEDGSSNRDSIIRDRFVQDIVGTASKPGMVWGLLAGMELMPGITVEPVTFEEVCDYDDLKPEEKAGFAARNTEKAVSIAVYLAFEDAVKKAKEGAPVGIDSVLGLGNLSADLFGGVMESFAANIEGAKINHIDGAAAFVASQSGGLLTAEQVKALYTGGEAAIYALVADMSDGLLTAKQVEALYTDGEEAAYALVAEQSGGLLTAEQVEALYAGGDAAIYAFVAAKAGLDAATVEALYNNANEDIVNNVNHLKTAVEGVNTAKAAVPTVKANVDLLKDVVSNVDMLCTLLALPETLSAAVQGEPALAGLLGLFARCVVGNGLGGHPSQTGHNQLFETVKTVYEEKYTAQDETVKNLKIAAEILADLVAEYYDEAYAYAYDYAEENGYIDILVEGLDTADKALADIDVDAIPLSEEFTEEFKEKLEESIANARETIAQAKKLVLEADELDQASLDELLALLDELLVNVTDVAELLEIAAADTYNDVMPILIDALIKLRDQAVKQLTIAIQKGTEWLMNKAQEAFDAFVEALMEALPVADQYLYDWFYNNPDKVVGFFYEYGDDMGVFMAEHYEAFLAVIGYIGYTFGDEILEFVMENPDTVLKVMVNWYENYGERTWAMIDRYAEYLGLYDYLEEVKEQLEEAYAKAEDAVKAEIAKAMAQIEEELAEIRGLIEEAIRESAEEAEKVILEKLEELGEAVEELVAKIEALLEEAVSAEYIPTVDSKYVAIGDSSVTGKGAKEAVVPYAERLAEELELRADQYVNLGLDGATTADLFAVVEDNADELKDADLITVGLSVNAMLTEALDAAKADELPEYDWSTYLPEEAVVYIEEKLAEVEAELSTNESLAKYAPMMTSVVEGLGYNYVEFAFEYPELVNRIHELAAEDAQVIMVGLYNPMEGLELADINIGEYVDYITRLANIHLTAYSLITPDTVYVDAPDVDTFAEHTEYKNEYLFLLNFVNGNHIKAQFATAEGHEYIKDQILDRMDIIRLWGDVNRDGKVNSKDAVAILRYVIRLVDASELDLTVGDLNADGKVSSKDAVLILQYCIKMITKFPVEA